MPNGSFLIPAKGFFTSCILKFSKKQQQYNIKVNVLNNNNRNQAVNDFVKKKKVFLKGCFQKKGSCLLAYLNKNSKR